jgi:hypothetical protein
MANKNIEQFITTYGPVAQQVSKEINVDPNVLLSQWGLESRWGQSEMAKTHNNVGGIKDFSGHGHEAKDNKTGSVDKYVKFEDPEVFGMYYADQIKRNFPLAVNTGPDIGAFTRGLASGKKGSYFEVTPLEYEKSLASAQSALPSELPFEPSTQAKPADGEGDMVVKDAPPAPPPPPDATGASPGERFLGGAAGTGVGLLATGVKGTVNALDNRAVARATAVENAKIAAQRAAGVVPPAAPAAAPPGGPKPPLGSTIMKPGGAPAVGGLPTPMGVADAGRMAQGQTGVIPYNTAKALGVTDIEAGQALTNTKQAGGAWDIATKRADALNKLQGMGMGNFAENPMYGGIMTEAPSVGGGPRESFTMKAPVAPNPDLPQGQPGGLSQLPPKQVIPTAPPPPPPPSVGTKAKAGLDWITGKFAGMLKPVVTAVGTAGKYALPPLAGLSAGLDVAEMGHEYDKPEAQRDYTKMGLKAASAIGGGLSLFPPTAAVGIPLSLGATAAQAYREDPEYFNQKMKEYTGYSP